MSSLERAAKRHGEAVALIAQARPELAQQLAEHLAKVQAEIVERLQFMVDYGEGRISQEEFERIVEERRAARLKEAKERYGEGPVLTLYCEECGEPHEWDLEEQGGYPDPYFTCEDVTGEDCQDEDDEDVG